MAGRLAAQHVSAPAACDLLIAGGTVIARASRAGVLFDGAIAVTGDRIVAVGPTAELQKTYSPARTIAAKGGVVMPGLVNTHNHSPLMIVRGMAPDLGFAPAYIKDIPQGDALSDDDALALARLGALELLRLGSTTVIDHYQHPAACARAVDELGLRAFVGGRILDVDVLALARGEWRRDAAKGDKTLRDNLDLVDRWHGHDGGRIHCVLAPHAPDTCSPELLGVARDEAARRGLQVHLHLAQSPLEVERVRARSRKHPIDVLDDLGMLNDRLMAAHCIEVDADQARRMGAARINVSHAPVGNAQGAMTAPIQALADAGAQITLCTDSKSGDMFEVMRAALWVARIRSGDLAVKADTVLDWATTGGARALGLADQVGALQPGFKADILVLDAGVPSLAPLVDGIGVTVHAGSGNHVRHVLIDGRPVLEDFRPTRVNPEAIIAEAQAVADRLWRGSALYVPR